MIPTHRLQATGRQDFGPVVVAGAVDDGGGEVGGGEGDGGEEVRGLEFDAVALVGAD